MLKRAFFAVLVLGLDVGCSGSDGGNDASGGTHSGGTDSGGATATTGTTQPSEGGSSATTTSGGAPTGGVTGQSTATSTNASCPVWPQEQLFPFMGPFFYGPDPGPCTSTSAGVVYTYAYDASGKPTSYSSADGATVETYLYDAGLLRSSTTTYSSGSTLTLAYQYGTASASYSWVSGTTTYGSDFTLDALGYPQTETWTTSADSSTVTVQYKYVDCLLKQRLTYLPDGSIQESVEYGYDAEQRLVSLTSALSTRTFDYSCW